MILLFRTKDVLMNPGLNNFSRNGIIVSDASEDTTIVNVIRIPRYISGTRLENIKTANPAPTLAALKIIALPVVSRVLCETTARLSVFDRSYL